MPYQIDSTTWRSPNFSSRAGAPSSIVIHSCEGALPKPKDTSLPWLCNPKSKVSAHYYICRNTIIFQLVSDANAAWHAGGQQENGSWTAEPAFDNNHSIGIECEHRSGQNWPAIQKSALAWLIRQLCTRYAIAADHIETHGQIAIAGPYVRKHDPSDWPHAAFVDWRDALFAQPIAYRVQGLPVFQRSDLTGPVVTYLQPDAPVIIDAQAPLPGYAPSAGHVVLSDGSTPGFIDMHGVKRI
jgi:N-acetyl-anhydromuramyl-L-alanine amidase AmpD